MKKVAVLLAAVLLAVPVVSEAGRKGRKPKPPAAGDSSCNLGALLRELPAESLRKKEASDLLFMREEEKLARDVYLSLSERWGLRVFRNIAGAESKHMAAVLTVIDRYGLEDPVGDNALGIFTDSELQALYEDLSALGAQSIESALLVGATIEDVDIYDLQRSLDRTDNEDIQVLYQNLMKGSRNHLRAFSRVLERYGVSYEPRYISVEKYEAILASPMEKGIVGADGELVCGGGRG